jgi:hypothetical protein
MFGINTILYQTPRQGTPKVTTFVVINGNVILRQGEHSKVSTNSTLSKICVSGN